MPAPAFASCPMTRDSRAAALRQFVSTDRCAEMGIAGRDRADDALVLLHRHRQLIHQRANVQTRVALDLRLDRPVQGEQPRADDVLDVGPMELLIEVEDPPELPPFRFLGELAVDLAQTASRSASAGRPGSDAAVCAASPSRCPTMRMISRPSSCVSGATMRRWSCPRPADETNPSCCSRCSALRTGVRLNPNRSATARSAMRAPGGRCPRQSGRAVPDRRARPCRTARRLRPKARSRWAAEAVLGLRAVRRGTEVDTTAKLSASTEVRNHGAP